jgi:hypothetical protein
MFIWLQVIEIWHEGEHVLKRVMSEVEVLAHVGGSEPT